MLKRREFLSLSASAIAATALIPRPSLSKTDESSSPSNEITSLRIFPAIGICRVGGSRQWFYAPEIPGLPPEDNDHYKDGTSLIKKQVQRFRIYAYDKDNNVIGEITSNEADITWGTHLANTKAAWYEFYNPLDNGELAPPIPGKKRNSQVKSNQQRERELVVNPGLVEITGTNTNAEGTEQKYQCMDEFMHSTQIKLGHLQTDPKGRLLVFPGDGVSTSPTGQGITSFADNDEWIDDWCDGPVFASVRLKSSGQTLQAEHAWVASAGPNFAPEITPIVTLYDLIQGMNFRQGWTTRPSTVSFRRDIYPILRRLDMMRWVSEAALLRQGWVDLGAINSEEALQTLADNSSASDGARNRIFTKIRTPAHLRNSNPATNDGVLPWMKGDGVNYPDGPMDMFSVTEEQYLNLKRWAKGDFINDYQTVQEETIKTFKDIPVAQQPQALNQAALEACSGGAFHPGVELTYNLRHPTIYQRQYNSQSEPFRIALGTRASLSQDLGPELTSTILHQGFKGEPSPIAQQMPGDLTRWMGIPWQCDAFSCQQVDTQSDFPTATWWPANVPIDVLPEQFFERANDPKLSRSERMIFASQRKRWSRRVAGVGYHANQGYWDGIENMISLWQRMGFVVRRSPTLRDTQQLADLSGDFFVETGRGIVDLPSPSDKNRP